MLVTEGWINGKKIVFNENEPVIICHKQSLVPRPNQEKLSSP